jgi:ribonuclease HI
MSGEVISGRSASLPESEVYAYTDGASTGSRGPGGYGVVISWKGKTEEISGGEQNTTNLRMEITAACVALERVMNLGKSRIEMRISRSAWFPRDLCFLHS